ncbi:unnamed protein product [Mucor hiemalis]
MSLPNRPPTVTSATPLRNNSSGRQYQQLIQQLNTVIRRLDNLEEAQMRPLTTPVARRNRVRDREGYNSQLRYHFKLAYERAVGRWDLDKSMKSSENIAVLNKIKAIALQMDPVKRYMASNTDPNAYSGTLEQTAEMVIRHQFDNLRKSANKQKMAAEERRRLSDKRKQIERKNRKLANRNAAFERLDDQLPIELDDGVMLERGECLPLLNREVMSDEEDGQMVGEGVASSFVVKRPRWRSDKANRLFSYLDDLHRNNSSQYHQRRDRSVEVVDVDVSDELRRRLPSWAVEE